MDSFFSFIQNFFETLLTWVLPSIFKVAIIILLAFFIQHLINLATNKFRFVKENGDISKRPKKLKRAETLSHIIHAASRAIIITVAFMMILNELGLDTRPILASAGILGVAFGLGAQNLMKDIINGFFILFEDQFGIGDTVKIGDISGIVETMTLRTTTIKDTLGNTHIIPNGQINQVSVILRG